MDTLQKHMPDRGPEGMDDLKKIALRFEEKIYSAAADQQDYLRRISTKMISLETKSQVSQGNTLPIISAGSSQKPLDPGPMISSQLRNPSQTLANDFPLTGQSQLQQQLQQNLPNSMSAGGMQSAAPLSSAMSPVSSLSQSTGGQCFGTQNAILNSTGQGLAQNALLANAQRQMQTRQQQHQQQVIQQQQSQVQQQLLQQKQHAILKQRLQQQSQHGPSMLLQKQQHFQQPQQQFQHQQQHIQNQQLVQQNQLPTSQQSILQQVQPPSLQSTQQSLMQHSQSSVLQSAQQTVQQQTQPSSLQQTSSSLLQKHQQPVVRHQQPQQAVTQQPSILQQQPPSLTNVSDMQQQQQQQQLQQLLQAKNAQHQQTQQASSSLLPSQSEQLQQQTQQQQLLSKLQPQPQQLQQQQPVLLQPNLTQQELQPRLHSSSVLLQQQQQNSIEQQKQLLQFQSRMMSDAATTNMESLAQTGQTTVVEMQERIYQRMQVLKEMYLPELQELYQKLHMRSQQAMPRDQLAKLQQYKDSVNGFIRIIQHPRGSILATTKEEKVDAFELKIKTILSQARLRRPALQQEGQQQIPPQTGIQVQPIQQSQLQISQMQQEKHVNHLQQMNSQVPMTSMQSNTVPPIQHSSSQMMLQSGLQTSQQNIQTAMQSVGNLNSTQGSGLGTFQQSSVSSLQHNNNNNSYTLQQNNSAIQQNSINSVQQSGISTLQNNINPVQSNVNALNHQAMKQEMLQVQRKIILAQQQQQQQQPLHQSQQFRQQHLQQLQQKHQQAAHLQAQFQAQQMPQLPQINDMSNDVNLKLKQTATVKQTLMQQNHSLAQRTVYQQQQQLLQFKTGTSLSVSSSPLLSTASPQVSQQSSPQIGQQNLVTSSVQVQPAKVGTPLQQMTSEDAEKQSSALSSISNVGCGQGVQQTATAIAIGAPGISASPLLDGFSPTHPHNVVNPEQTISAGLLIEDKSSTEEPPFERLIKVINKMSHKALASAVNDIGSVVSLMDRMAGSAPGNGSRAAVGEDLAAMTKCRLQARNLMSQDGNAATKKMKRHMNSIPLSTVSSGGTVTNSFQQYNNEESLEIKSTATSRIKRPRLEMSHVLQDELQEIYQQLIDTAVEISEDDDDAAALAAEGRDGVVLKCYYNAKALSPNMKPCYRLSQMTPISPLCLLIPVDYPNSSPVLLDKAPTGSCKEYVDLSSKARAKFHAAVRTLPQPMSILSLARTWDVSARSTVVEYAQQSGGGSFSSCFGTWESCTNA
ncbi:mediator of RNA polymerase II transcription subunit 15a isoform X2 [Cryptomeria japonica]|nr:mediator of RNA polymerase II transcription subunit 15a isoform X2 [Cryptomeria japonica]